MPKFESDSGLTETHFHRGHHANYPKCVCSICAPGEPMPTDEKRADAPLPEQHAKVTEEHRKIAAEIYRAIHSRFVDDGAQLLANYSARVEDRARSNFLGELEQKQAENHRDIEKIQSELECVEARARLAEHKKTCPKCLDWLDCDYAAALESAAREPGEQP